MQRRRYLSLCLAGAAVTTAGCSSDGGADTTPRDAVYGDAFREELTDEGITIRTFSTASGTVTLEYEPSNPTEDGVRESINTTARAFFDRVYGGWHVERLEATVFVDGTVVATWEMRRRWIEAYLDGDITRDQLGEKVEASVERHDEAADTDGDTETAEQSRQPPV